MSDSDWIEQPAIPSSPTDGIHPPSFAIAPPLADGSSTVPCGTIEGTVSTIIFAMATRSTFVYSAAAVRRLMGLPASVPVQIREFLNVVWVWVKGDRPTFVSKADLKRHFVEHRKDEAQTLVVTDWLRDPPRYTVKNPKTGSQHIVWEQRDRLDCDCEDYYWQQQFIGRGCCKHGYAVLQYLGFDSLSDFIAAQDHQAAA